MAADPLRAWPDERPKMTASRQPAGSRRPFALAGVLLGTIVVAGIAAWAMSPTIGTYPAPSTEVVTDLGLMQTIDVGNAGDATSEVARSIALGGDGTLWVLYEPSARVQQFDMKSGQKLITIQPAGDAAGEIIADDLAADGTGHLFVARTGEILRYRASDGALDAMLPRPQPGGYMYELTLASDGSIWGWSGIGMMHVDPQLSQSRLWMPQPRGDAWGRKLV
jgi:hypothetical protein